MKFKFFQFTMPFSAKLLSLVEIVQTVEDFVWLRFGYLDAKKWIEVNS